MAPTNLPLFQGDERHERGRDATSLLIYSVMFELMSRVHVLHWRRGEGRECDALPWRRWAMCILACEYQNWSICFQCLCAVRAHADTGSSIHECFRHVPLKRDAWRSVPRKFERGSRKLTSAERF